MSMYLAIGVGAFFNGAMAGWVAQVFNQTYFNIPVQVWAFLIVWAAAIAYFSYQRMPTGVIGVSLYILGIFIVLVPISEYAPLIVAAISASDRLDTALLIEGLTGLMTWGLVASILGITFAMVSKRLSRRADQVYQRYMKQQWRDDTD